MYLVSIACIQLVFFSHRHGYSYEEGSIICDTQYPLYQSGAANEGETLRKYYFNRVGPGRV